VSIAMVSVPDADGHLMRSRDGHGIPKRKRRQSSNASRDIDVTYVTILTGVTDVPGVTMLTDVPDVTMLTDVPDVTMLTDVPVLSNTR